jgi:hypothetical protein
LNSDENGAGLFDRVGIFSILEKGDADPLSVGHFSHDENGAAEPDGVPHDSHFENGAGSSLSVFIARYLENGAAEPDSVGHFNQVENGVAGLHLPNPQVHHLRERGRVVRQHWQAQER